MSAAPIKTAMVMAAGHGTRMRPLTNDRSKAMVELDGKPLIDHMFDRLIEAGVTRAVVNVHAHAQNLIDHIARHPTDLDITISDEREELLETGGGVVKALPLLGRGPVYICNIDAVWLEGLSQLGQLAAHWNPAAMDDLLLLAPIGNTLGYGGAGDFEIDTMRRLTRRSGASAPYVYAGVQIADLSPMRGLEIKPFSRNRVWDKSLKAGRMYGQVMDGYWMHVGDPRALIAAEAVLAQSGGTW